MLYIMMHFLHYTLLYSLPTVICICASAHTHTDRKTFPQTPTKDIHTYSHYQKWSYHSHCLQKVYYMPTLNLRLIKYSLLSLCSDLMYFPWC